MSVRRGIALALSGFVYAIEALLDAVCDAFTVFVEAVKATFLPPEASIKADAIRHEAEAVPIAHGRQAFVDFKERALNHTRFVAGQFTQGESAALC